MSKRTRSGSIGLPASFTSEHGLIAGVHYNCIKAGPPYPAVNVLELMC